MRPNSDVSLEMEVAPSRVPRLIGFHAARWGLLVALGVLTYLLYPVAGGFDAPLLEPGDVATSEVIAPFAFQVRKTPTEIEREAAQLEATARPYYDYVGAGLDSALAATDSLFEALSHARSADSLTSVAQAWGLTPDEAAYLAGRGRLDQFRRAVRLLLRRQLRRGVAARGTLENEASRDVIIRRDGSESVAPRDTLLTFERFLDSRRTVNPDPTSPRADPILVKVINRVFHPTLVPNRSDYERVRREMRASVDSVKYNVRANERIVDANQVVTPDIRDRLMSLRREILRRGGGGGRTIAGTGGQILMNALVLTVFWLLLLLYRPSIYASFRQMAIVAALMGMAVVGAAVNRQFITGVPELIPIPFAAMLLTVLFRGRVAMVGAIVLAVLIGSQAVYGGTDALFIALVGGVAAAVSVRTIRRRNQFLAAAGVVAVAYLLAGVTVGLRLDWSLAHVGLTGLRGGLTALASAALASTLLPVFEAVGGVTTELTLLELTDPNRPLLRRLAIEAPGTYAHSVAMANLCEAACNAIGANGLLARVGCYYHDIGKVRKPHFFVENQSGGANPHDKLKPEVSASILRNHVRDGMQLAEEHKLPDVVKDFIVEHHGTMGMAYFLERAKSRTGEEEVDPAEYRYPGPRPHTVETAVAMLADGVEAAVRVLAEPTPERLRDAIDHIIRQRVEAGELDDAPLTLAQLAQVRDEFVRTLGGEFHDRIDYPASGGGIGADWEPASTS